MNDTLSIKIARFLGTGLGAVIASVVIFGFYNWIELYLPGTGGPANLYLVGWVAFIAGADWRKTIDNNSEDNSR